MAQTIRTAIVWVGLQITVGGELTRAPAVNTSFWSSVSDGLDDGFWLSQGAIAAFSGVWPYLCMVILLLLWFIPRSLRSWITASILGTKWCVWYLIFAFLQALAFQYRAVITLLPGNPLEFRTFLDVDIQASDGVYLLAAGSIVIQTVGNIVFIADARLGTGGEEAHTDKWDKPAEDQTCYPLFLTMFWRSSRSAEYNWACPRVLTMVWATLCQLVVAALLVCGVALTAAGLVEDLFTTRQQAGIELEITLREPNRTEALLPLTFAVANGSLAGPGVELDTYEVLGQLILSSIFFVVFVLAPLLLFVVLAVIWAVPLTSRWRKVAVNAAILCQSWNCQDMFALALFVGVSDMADLTGTLADGACADVADLVPGLITEGQYCLTTSIELRSGFFVLGAAALVQWLALCVMYTLVRVDMQEEPYYPLPRPSRYEATASLLYGSDQISTGRDAIDVSRSSGAVWAHDAPDERSSFARTDQPRGRSSYGSDMSSNNFGGGISRRRATRYSVNEVVRGDDRGGCRLQ